MELVGRDHELAVLHEELVGCAAGTRRLVLIEGEPGIGKTSLLDAFRAIAAATGAVHLTGAAWEDGAPSYWPWTQVIRAASHVAGAEVQRRRDPLGPLGPLGPGASVDRFVMYDAVADLLAEMARATPVVVALEDLHAAGPSTADLLEYVHRATAGSALLLLATLRPAEAAADAGLAEVVARLEGLSTVLSPRPFAAADVARVLAAQRVSPGSGLVEAVLERTQGNPLFVVHTARALAAGGAAETTGLPLGLRHALRRQAAAAVVSGADGVMEAAAVLGEQITPTALEAMTGAPIDAVLATLERAVGAGLLRRDAVMPESHAFTHALVREAVYDGIAPLRVAEAHLRAARVLEAAGAPAYRLAWHFSRAWPAGGVAETVRFGTAAGDQATRAHAHAEAARAYRLAVQAHDRLPVADPVGRLDLLLALADAELRAGRLDASHYAAQAALALARGVDGPRPFARAALLGSQGLPFNAVHAAAVDVLREADERFGDDARDDADEGLRDAWAAVVARLAEVTAPFDRDEAVRLAARAESLAPELAAAMAARLEVEWGRHAPRAALARATRLAAAVDDPAEVSRAATWGLVFALELGDITTATRTLATLDQVAHRSRQPALAHLATSRRAMLATLAGDVESGLAAAREARDLAARFGLPDGEAVAWGQLFCAWRVTALRPEEAEEMEQVARHLAAESPYVIAHAGAVVQMLLARGDVDEARGLFARLMSQLDALPHDLLRLWSLALLAEDAVALGDVDAARRVYDALAPYDGRFVVAAGGVACLGSASHQLGILAALLGRDDVARAHLEAAVDAHRRAACSRLLVASQDALAALRAATVSLRLSDGIVTIRLGADAVSLPASLGLAHLAVLVGQPGREVAATRLAALAAGEERVGAPSGDDLAGERVPDEILDRQALASYRARLAELDAELGEVQAWHDEARRELLESERDAIVGQLRIALGLGGRQRRFADEAERARVNVTRAIRSAIRRVGERAPSVGEHLDRTISTGNKCCYDPARLTDPKARRNNRAPA